MAAPLAVSRFFSFSTSSETSEMVKITFLELIGEVRRKMEEKKGEKESKKKKMDEKRGWKRKKKLWLLN